MQAVWLRGALGLSAPQIAQALGWHRAKRLQLPANLRLIPVPPWSPQRNPVEPLWDEVREK
ncbi:MAG: hypothetical protein JO150_16230 [Acidobacteriaceae bacterium]|nr:hypothetical protein [Acidobacteriaceae bacterium]MBV9940054.1 hypothetical protein [Acidobacteriaceae bacterium]